MGKFETVRGTGSSVAVAVQRTPTAQSWRRVRQAGRRLSWGLADQAMSTLTNFLLSIFVARTLGAAQFGAFSLAYVTYGFAINASRGVSIEPLLIRFSGTDVPTWRRAVAGCTGTALLVGLATGICALAAGLLVGGTTGLAFIALGLTLPGLLLQDSWRYAFFALGRGHYAFINDTIWAAVQIPLLVFLRITGHANVFWFVIAWGIAATVAGAIAPLQAGTVPNLAGAMRAGCRGTATSAPAISWRIPAATLLARCKATVFPTFWAKFRRRRLYPGRQCALGPHKNHLCRD